MHNLVVLKNTFFKWDIKITVTYLRLLFRKYESELAEDFSVSEVVLLPL